jgi:hypothetical protein
MYRGVAMKCGIITIAIGKKYRTQAKYLAYSCILHAPSTLRAVITDVPAALASYYDFCIPYKSAYGDPFTTKTRLHLYTPFDKTLYIDADSLVMQDIGSFWDSLESRPFAYSGDLITSGEWYFDIAGIIRKLGLSALPKFNSGMFLFDKSETAKNIFETAYDYLTHQKDRDLGVDFFRGKMLPDEPFLSIALAKNAVEPFEDNGRFSRTLIGAENIRLDSIRGIAFFRKHGVPVFPLIVHFCSTFGQFLFIREKLRLFFYFNPPVYSLFVAICTGVRKLVKKK